MELTPVRPGSLMPQKANLDNLGACMDRSCHNRVYYVVFMLRMLDYICGIIRVCRNAIVVRTGSTPFAGCARGTVSPLIGNTKYELDLFWGAAWSPVSW